MVKSVSDQSRRGTRRKRFCASTGKSSAHGVQLHSSWRSARVEKVLVLRVRRDARGAQLAPLAPAPVHARTGAGTPATAQSRAPSPFTAARRPRRRAVTPSAAGRGTRSWADPGRRAHPLHLDPGELGRGLVQRLLDRRLHGELRRRAPLAAARQAQADHVVLDAEQLDVALVPVHDRSHRLQRLLDAVGERDGMQVVDEQHAAHQLVGGELGEQARRRRPPGRRPRRACGAARRRAARGRRRSAPRRALASPGRGAPPAPRPARRCAPSAPRTLRRSRGTAG